jgi:hypothetical protein
MVQALELIEGVYLHARMSGKAFTRPAVHPPATRIILTALRPSDRSRGILGRSLPSGLKAGG